MLDLYETTNMFAVVTGGDRVRLEAMRELTLRTIPKTIRRLIGTARGTGVFGKRSRRSR
jgi:hypothetical protein